MNQKQKKIFEEFNKRGYVAFFYPRLKMIAINGGQMKPIKEQIQEMLDVINLISGKV